MDRGGCCEVGGIMLLVVSLYPIDGSDKLRLDTYRVTTLI